jgi:hypothetical protein
MNVVSIGFGESLVGIARRVHALEAEVVGNRWMDHRGLRIERGFRIGDCRQFLVVDRDSFAAVLGFGAAARHHGADRFAGPAGAVDGNGVLRRRFEALEVRQHADPRRDDLRQFRAGDHGDDAGRFLGGSGIDALDPGMRVR